MTVCFMFLFRVDGVPVAHTSRPYTVLEVQEEELCTSIVTVLGQAEL